MNITKIAIVRTSNSWLAMVFVSIGDVYQRESRNLADLLTALAAEFGPLYGAA